MTETRRQLADRKLAISLPPRWRSLFSLWLVIHFGLLATAISSQAWSSTSLEKLLAFASPYLSPLHLRVDSLPLTLASGSDNDWEHSVQWRPSEDDSWQELNPAHFSGNTHRKSLLARAVGESASVEDTATATLLLMPLIEQLELSGALATAQRPQIRVVAFPYQAEPIERWSAAIVNVQPKDDEVHRAWSLTSLSERRLNAAASSKTAPTE